MEVVKDLLWNSKKLLIWYDAGLGTSKTANFIDPLNVIVVLALLKYKSIGTKLLINSNFVYIDEFNRIPIFQSIFRNLKGHKKEDLKQFYQPIIHACKHFLNTDNCAKMKPLFVKAVEGLTRLHQTYKCHTVVCNLITIYTNIINRSLDDYEETMEFLDTLVQFGISSDSDDNVTSKMMDVKNDIYSQLNMLWSENTLTIIINIFNELDEKQDANRTHMFDSIDALLHDSNENVKVLLKEFTTSSFA